MSTVIGLDIGGTSSRAQLSVDGVVVAEAEAASASLTAAGPARADAALAGLLAGLPAGPDRPVDAICAGTAGHVPDTCQFLHERLAPLTRTGTVVIVNDAVLVLAAAGLDDGIAVICGTGSIAVGRHRDRSARAGGWGYLLGDEGSGYWIVREAVRTLLDRRDRGAAAGDLGARLLAAAGAGHVDALAQRFYSQPRPRQWASYAPVILDSADPAVGPLAALAARALAELAATVAERLGSPGQLPVALAGGLTGHPALAAAVRSALAAAMPGSEVVASTQPPVAGAVRLARAAVVA